MSAPSLLARIAAAALIAGGFWLVGAWSGGAANAALTRTRIDPNLRLAVARGAPPAIFSLGVLAAISALGIDTRGLLVVLAAVGLGAGLALRGPLADLYAGVLLMTRRPFAAGDRITVGALSGRVQSLDLLATTVETPEGDRISLGNERVWSGPLRIHPPEAPSVPEQDDATAVP